MQQAICNNPNYCGELFKLLPDNLNPEVVDQVKAFRESDIKLTPITMFKQVTEMDKGRSHPALKFMNRQKFCWDTVDLPIGFLMDQMKGKPSKVKRMLYLIFLLK